MIGSGKLILVWLSDRRCANGFRIKYLRSLEEAIELVRSCRSVLKVSLDGEVMDKEAFLSLTAVRSGV